MIDHLLSGLGAPSLALSVSRFALGTFFSISGYHKLLNAKRHLTIEETMRDNQIPFPKFFGWLVPTFEFLCGSSLVLGLLSIPSAFALSIICTVACLTDGRRRVKSYKPIDFLDKIDDWLYLPELLYILLLGVVLLAGPGYLSLDFLVANMLH